MLWDEIDWSLEPEFLLRDPALTDTDLLPDFPFGSLIDSRLVADIVSGRSFFPPFDPANPDQPQRILRGRVGVRLDGLAAGYYRVFGIAAEPALAVQAWVGTSAAEVGRETLPNATLHPVLESGDLQQWKRDQTYFSADIAIEEGESLWVITARRSPGDPDDPLGIRHGALAGLQVVSIARELVVERFAATPNTIETGQAAGLSWSVPTATETQITPSSPAAPAPLPPVGTLDVFPTETTTYQLTAADSFQANSAELEITVLAATPPEVRRRILADLADLEDLLLTPLPSELYNDVEKLDQAKSAFDKAAGQIGKLLSHPAVIDDPETFRRTVRTGIGIAATGQLIDAGASANLPALLGPASDRFTARQDEKQGLDPTTGDVNREFIADRFTGDESFEVVTTHLASHGEASLQGGEREISVPLLEAHVENLFGKFLKPYGYSPQFPRLSPSLLRGAGEQDLAKTAAALAVVGETVPRISD